VVHFIPHGQLTVVSNMSHGFSQAFLNVGVSYNENVDRVMEVLMEVAGELRYDKDFGPLLLDDPEMLGVDRFGESEVVISFYVKTAPLKQWKVRRELMRRIKKKFDEEGIEIPFPHRTLVWGSESAVVPVSGPERASGYSQPGEPGSAAHRSSQHDAKQPAGLAPEESSTRSHNTPASPSSAGSTVKAAR
jgi:small conductance mechanosensitive channel